MTDNYKLIEHIRTLCRSEPGSCQAMTDALLWGVCLSGWLFDIYLVASQVISGGIF